jgi:hypothetical protein
MATKNNWLKTNIKDKLLNPNLNFKVWHDLESVRDDNWDTALFDTVTDFSWISKKLYIPLSGGMDSEFVFESLKHLYPTPIIVDTPGNKTESAYAFHYCRKNDLKPVVIEKTESQMLHIFYEDIFKKLNGYGMNSVSALIAGRYAEDHGGVAVIGEHGYDDNNEWDFYNDALIHEENSIYFFMWTLELVKAMREEYDNGIHQDHQEFKHSLYKIPFRPKIKYHYSRLYDVGLNIINSKRRFKPNPRSFIKW